jgi:hypothetical protein
MICVQINSTSQGFKLEVTSDIEARHSPKISEPHHFLLHHVVREFLIRFIAIAETLERRRNSLN